jgi:hypothetical protein
MDRTLAQKELQQIARTHGKLSPQIIVDAARHNNSALHGFFEWDDTVAAEKYRIEQARTVIKMFVIEVPVGADIVITAQYQIAGTPAVDGEAHYEDVLTILSDADKEYGLVVATLERARDILQRCPHPVTQKMAHRVSSEIQRLPRPKRKK